MKIIKTKKVAKTTQLTLLSFFLLVVAGGFLLNLPQANQGPHDLLNSFFTSCASVCVAGLSTVTAATQYTLLGKIIMLILIQIGALGFIVVMSSFFTITKRKLTYKDKINISTALGTGDNYSIIKNLIKRVLKFTFFAELIGAIVLSFRFIPMFGPLKGIGQSIFTSVSAFCNCGYDLLGPNSLRDFATDYLVLGVCGALTVLGSLGFIVWNDIVEKFKIKKQNNLSIKKTWLSLNVHTKLVLTMLGVMVFFGSIIFLIIEYNNTYTLGNYGFFDKLFISIFHGISARTTGMAAVDLSRMTASGKFFTIILMLVGGAPGSTAGGLKTVTVGVLLLTMLSSASGNKNVTAYEKEISNDTIKQAVTILISALMIVSVICMTLSILNPDVSFIDILFETVSALATCGYSLGITSSLTVASKIILMLTMYIGRVSTVTMTMALTGNKFKQKRTLQYPKANIAL